MTAQEDAPKIHADLPETPEKPGIRPPPVDDNLDPMKVHNGGVKQLRAEIKRSAQGFRETDGVVVRFKGWNADEKRGSYTSNNGDPLPFGPANLRVLNLDPEVVAFNLDQIIKVEYTAYRDGEDPVTSEVLELKVLDLAPEDLTAGVIFGKDDDGTGDVLDLTTDTDDRTVRVEIWPLIAKGQWCWIVLKGKKADGNDYERELFKDEVNEDWITLGYKEVSVLYSELKLLADGSVLTLGYRVAFDQVDDESKANLSEVRSYTVKAAAVVKPTIGEVTDSEGAPVTNPGTTNKTPLALEGTVAPGKDLDIYEGENQLGVATVTGTTWTFVTEV
ncbi:hypothetical protein KRR23_25275, partial [Pseudomonas sp. CVAP|uniref:hypothetical protein n=1 Tax=Pseudomonas sp. CVAP\